MATNSNVLYWPLPVSLVTEWPASPGRPSHTGTDFKCAVGTPIPATSDGTIVYVGDDGLGGRTVDLLRADGLLQRFGHLSRYLVQYGQFVKAGTPVGLSGNTGMSTGPHLHWELRWDRAWTGGNWVDPRTLSPLSFEGENDMTPEQSQKLDAIFAGIYGPANVGASELKWSSLNGPQKAQFGNLEIDIYTQKLVAQLQGQVAALTEAVKALPGGGTIDMDRIEAAAREGALEGIQGVTFVATKP